MTVTSVEITDPRGTRSAGEGDFPLTLGGPEADVLLGAGAAGPIAFLGLSGGDVFVQPAGGSAAGGPAAADGNVSVNGAAVESSQWLGDGDVVRSGAAWIAVEVDGEVLRLEVRADREEGRDAPPLIAPPRVEPREATGEIRTIEPIPFEPTRELAGSRRRRAIRPAGIAVGLVLLALTAAAGFLLTSRSVLVEIEPTPESLRLEGGLVFELGGRHVLRPGSYRLRAEKAGFTALETTVEVTRDSQQTFRFTLDKLPGLLQIDSPVAGAEVLVDGESFGTTPLEPLELAPGEHRVTVRADRYRDFVAAVVIEGAGSEQALAIELEPHWAEVEFASRPAGARVRVGGEDLGTTPLAAEVLEGRHDFQLLLAGHKPHRGRLEVIAGEPQSLPSIRLQPADGNLVLSSQPAGATVSVGGAYRGETPLDLFLEPGREHQVVVSKAGHANEKLQVRVESGQSRQLDVELVPQEGEVRFSTWPAGAELVVDGEARGEANQTLELTAVAHQVEVRKEGFVAHRQEVTPLPGVPQLVEVTLKPEGAARREQQAAATPDVVTRHGHELRLIQPGKLRLGASRREAGRRANEVLREVELTRRFYLSSHEVSNRQFRRFQAEHASGMIGGHTLELDPHPAVRVTWDQAAAYCNWLSRQEGLAPAYVDQGGKMVAAAPMTTGYRLPTEAEWAWAARYDAEGTARKYPWGASMPVPAGAGNYADASASGLLPGVVTDYNDQFPVTAPADSFGADARGFYHFGGNVAEWVHDYYAIRLGGSGKVERDPRGPKDGEFHVIRGSSWMHSTVTELRLTYRDYGSEPRPDVGFRVARYAE